ncbi:hypothetical protein [Polymorphospora sp. NPDC050346]|uniref:hypothetical protein n=1 Tax=Polymorphospora sp. NPDC050346 TaxID=3155780 RepID=UPI0033D23F96
MTIVLPLPPEVETPPLQRTEIPAETWERARVTTMLVDLARAAAWTWSAPSTWERARFATILVDLLKRLSSVAAEVRRQAVEELVDGQRVPQARVARHIGVSTSRLSQIVKAGRREQHSGGAR